ncbi:ABC transporter ATP-binding protein [Haematobacter massiliensis]|uniref:Iron ABC transporter n=1 Tax=Haematobacter massiliensis TaxID=195105 RepID=A0A086Y5M5_9RHOB|nr:ABC transporter ATP-binding protein [Haematobacter massiliensis]KFI29575.1 iron ABC transporter [Haematobacter massiliensis]OWJ73044.1 ABC transporter ATP-binding protein [Haematobacter massiliensis]OWJ88286.1 ABC transporter ATP-binding protein [Haematobacter massiliensis]QBJ25641.1 ABC transporter ATP-binding protein [Haematobacter massiliensis]
MTGLEVSDLSVQFGARRVLDGLTLPPLREGELTVLAGPNAAGKSTLLRAVAQLLPYRGRVTLNGQDLHRLPGSKRAMLLGFMPQSLATGSSLIVLESIIAALRAGGEQVRGAAETVAMATLDRLGIGNFALEPVDSLSGGQRQMVGLAQAIVRNPRVLLLDEPTSALDLAYQARLLAEVRRLAAEGRTVIAVLHDLALAAQWSDNMVMLRRGCLYSAGRPEEVLTPAMLAEVYGVSARVERCSRGRLMVLVDEELPSSPRQKDAAE